MVRGLMGFAGLFVVAVVGFKLIGFLLVGFLAILSKLLWFAFLGWLIYLALRILSPSTADRVREVVTGKPKSV